ncbi:methyl-accepting chemotaxis sensory transducer [Thermodesulfobium narugense DSM 14796]|uniref:Methyl-accepting chemotaxis sensory transducer n=1 Tax=Thermodesulfobium narugense DSM 14796 TaxID=747365 RepID=M1E7Y2_9BACT|nr:cache domain-containing protein [Thermodesulfobium narugense]AEE14199.1 methyl-accepting chemotaxis sensory transducer [Thermodesulfobium narugense DSM 14796]
MRIFRIFLNAALRKKMGIMVLLSFFVFGLLLSGGGLIQIYNFSNEILLNDITNTARGINSFLDSKISDTKKAALTLASDHDIISGVKNKDSNSLFVFIEKFAQLYPGLYVVVTDSDGKVLARSDAPSISRNDNISELPEIKSALDGKVQSGIGLGRVVGLSIRSGAPVKDEKGKIIGTISTGYRIAGANEISNQIKNNFGVEVAFFQGNEMVSTSIKPNELSQFSKFFNPSVFGSVLKEGKPINYGAPTNISELYSFAQEILFGKPYFGYYYPLRDVDGNILGMYFIAKDTSFYNNMLKRFTIMQFALNITAIIIGIILLLLSMEFFFMRPIGLLVKDIKRVASGDLSQPLNPVFNDELGVVVRAVESIRSNFINVIGKINYAIKDLVNASSDLMSVSSSLTTSSGDVSKLSEINAKGAENLSNIATKLNEDKNILLKGIQGISKGVEDQAIAASNIAQNINRIARSIEDFTNKLGDVSNSLLVIDTNVKEIEKNILEKKNAVGAVTDIARNINSISDGVKEVSEKIRMSLVPIQTIANQIQLWSSNAIIETSKLGEQGKAFGVIIDEIRSLSEKLLYTSNEISSNLNERLFNSNNFDFNFDRHIEGVEDLGNYFTAIEDSVKTLKDNISNLYQKFEKIKDEALGIISSKDIKNVETSLANLAALAEEDLSNVHDLNRASLDVQKAIENLVQVSKDTVSSTKDISERAEKQLNEAGKLEEVSNDIKMKSNELEDEVRKFKI